MATDEEILARIGAAFPGWKITWVEGGVWQALLSYGNGEHAIYRSNLRDVELRIAEVDRVIRLAQVRRGSATAAPPSTTEAQIRQPQTDFTTWSDRQQPVTTGSGCGFCTGGLVQVVGCTCGAGLGDGPHGRGCGTERCAYGCPATLHPPVAARVGHPE